MAQRTGADGFLALRPKTVSAGGILALTVAAVLALSGCGGGGGSDPSSVASAPGSSTGTEAPAAKKSSPSQSSPSSGKSQDPKSSGQSPDSSNPQSQDSAKHGTHIVLPKGEPEKGPTPTERAQATVADIALASPELQSAPGAEANLSAINTCDGQNRFPALLWQGVPAGTKELALYIVNAQPVDGKLFVDWALTGIDPSLEGLKAGELPQGAIVGQNSFGNTGYEICPPQGSGETYVFTLYALPTHIPASQGFEPRQLREEILETSGNAGLMAAGYER